MLPPIVASLRRGLIVSCQGEGDDPFNQPEYLASFASAASKGGALGIRACGTANIRAIRQRVSLPIIGITKDAYGDGSVLITADWPDVVRVLEAGADIVAVDGTGRIRPNGLKGHDFVRYLKSRQDVPIMADVSTLEEGLDCVSAGSDLIATTLAGYTPYTETSGQTPDWQLLLALVTRIKTPVVLEGRVWTPQEARHGLEIGAFAVVVGTAITRPTKIAHRFVREMSRVPDKKER